MQVGDLSAEEAHCPGPCGQRQGLHGCCHFMSGLVPLKLSLWLGGGEYGSKFILSCFIANGWDSSSTILSGSLNGAVASQSGTSFQLRSSG